MRPIDHSTHADLLKRPVGFTQRETLALWRATAASWLPAQAALSLQLSHPNPLRRTTEMTHGFVITPGRRRIFFKDWVRRLPSPSCSSRLAPLHGRLDCTDACTSCKRASGSSRRPSRPRQVAAGRIFGHDMDHYAADASAVAEHLDLKNAVHIGHSTGGAKSPATSLVTASRKVASPRRYSSARFRR